MRKRWDYDMDDFCAALMYLATPAVVAAIVLGELFIGPGAGWITGPATLFAFFALDPD